MEEIIYNSLSELLTVKGKRGRVYIELSDVTDTFFLESKSEVDEFVKMLETQSKEVFDTVK